MDHIRKQEHKFEDQILNYQLNKGKKYIIKLCNDPVMKPLEIYLLGKSLFLNYKNCIKLINKKPAVLWFYNKYFFIL